MIIRPARAEDAIAVADIWNPVIRSTTATFSSQEKSPEGLATDFAARHAEGKAFLLAEDAGRVLGFATYFQFRSGNGYAHTLEHTIVLSAAAQGKGVGRALMAAVEDHARAGGGQSLWAGVSAENQAGIGFHAAIGFANVACLPAVGFKFGRWIDLVLMQKILRNPR